ncbi:TPA: hypothetical protein ACFNMI_000154 [Neisseria bacilliformis]|uniref:hypothetical protein n=1 Tax=Neisseria bacilliformis TaxID=267212 RepID=UPI000B02A749|nr:hypothetical protein [Neisseria bacilliformis]
MPHLHKGRLKNPLRFSDGLNVSYQPKHPPKPATACVALGRHALRMLRRGRIRL